MKKILAVAILAVALVFPSGVSAWEPPDESRPPYRPYFLPPSDAWHHPTRWGWDKVLLGIEPVEDNPFRTLGDGNHIIAIVCIGRGVVRNGGWPYEEAKWYSWNLERYRPFIGDRGRRAK